MLRTRSQKSTPEKGEAQTQQASPGAKEQEARIAEALRIVKQFPATNDMFPSETRTMWQTCR